MAKKPIKPSPEPTPASPDQQEQFMPDRGASFADIKPDGAEERGPSTADIQPE